MTVSELIGILKTHNQDKQISVGIKEITGVNINEFGLDIKLQDSNNNAIGKRVIHHMFGEGEIVEVTEDIVFVLYDKDVKKFNKALFDKFNKLL